MLIYHNKSIKQIAEELGFSESGLYKIVGSPLFQMELQKELAIKQRMERESVLQQVASAGTSKLLEAVQTGKMKFEEKDKDGKIIHTEKVLDGREIVAITHDALDRTGHKPINRTIDATVDLGSMIMQAHKTGDQDVIEVDEDVIDAEVIKKEGE